METSKRRTADCVSVYICGLRGGHVLRCIDVLGQDVAFQSRSDLSRAALIIHAHYYVDGAAYRLLYGSQQ